MWTSIFLSSSFHILNLIFMTIRNWGHENLWKAFTAIWYWKWFTQMEAFQWLLDKWWVHKQKRFVVSLSKIFCDFTQKSERQKKGKHFVVSLNIINGFTFFVHFLSLSRHYNHHHVPTDNIVVLPVSQFGWKKMTTTICFNDKIQNDPDKEFIFQNLENGISLFNAETLETKLLMDNSSFVSQNHFNVAFTLLSSFGAVCEGWEMEIFNFIFGWICIWNHEILCQVHKITF
jgi:hypothetical protein